MTRVHRKLRLCIMGIELAVTAPQFTSFHTRQQTSNVATLPFDKTWHIGTIFHALLPKHNALGVWGNVERPYDGSEPFFSRAGGRGWGASYLQVSPHNCISLPPIDSRKMVISSEMPLFLLLQEFLLFHRNFCIKIMLISCKKLTKIVRFPAFCRPGSAHQQPVSASPHLLTRSF